MKKYIKIFLLIFAIIFGVFLFFYGGYDDSPGAQGLGMILAVGGISGLVMMKSKK